MNRIRNEIGRVRLRGGLSPIGTSSAATYWGRRLIALVVLGLVVIGLLGLGATLSGRPGTKVPAATRLSPTAEARVVCRGSQVTVRIVGVSRTAIPDGVISGSPTTTRSGPPQVTIQVTNHAKAACVLDTQDVGVMGVDRTGRAWWMSVSCAASAPSSAGLMTLSPSAPVTWTIDWKQQGRGSGCAGAMLASPGAINFYGLAMGQLTMATVLAPSTKHSSSATPSLSAAPSPSIMPSPSITPTTAAQ